MQSLVDLFDTIPRNSFQRVDESHPADLYIGKDEKCRWTILLITDSCPQKADSSKMISVETRKRKDGKWTISFSLLDEEYGEIYVLFCNDVIESSRLVKDKKKASAFIVKRYLEWKEMLANARSSLLSPEEVKGLFGEMYFLMEYMTMKYGIEKASLSWTGPKMLPQDFIVDDTWYEVKTIGSNRKSVKISSIEQLNSDANGHLVIVYADKTSITNAGAMNLNSLYKKLLGLFTDDNIKIDFSNTLLKYGYHPRQEYETEEYTFEVKSFQMYAVTSEFPCLRRKLIPTSIETAKYDLNINTISKYLVV